VETHRFHLISLNDECFTGLNKATIYVGEENMKLLKVLETVNQIEKSSFLKILDGICIEKRSCAPDVERILSQGEGQLKNVGNKNIVSLFQMLKDCYKVHLNDKLEFDEYHLDILVDILSRDGNAKMSREWFQKLYKNELARVKGNIEAFEKQLAGEGSLIEPRRSRDYTIYQSCLRTAYENDALQNRDKRISWEERTVLNTLARCLDLSNEEVRWMTYTILPLVPLDVDIMIGNLKEAGNPLLRGKRSP